MVFDNIDYQKIITEELLDKAPVVLVELAFQLGRNYEYFYNLAGLYNPMDVRDFAFAKSCGGMMESGNLVTADLPQAVFGSLDKRKIDALCRQGEDFKAFKAAVSRVAKSA